MIIRNQIKGTFIKRYKRFFVDCKLENGDIVTAHCPNSGSMKSLLNEKNKVYLTFNDDPKRKLKYTLNFMQLEDGSLVCVNTNLPNELIYDSIKSNLVDELKNPSDIVREVKYGEENSRIDVLCKIDDKEVFVEVKNVTLIEEEENFNLKKIENLAQFPDAITHRGAKHLRELSKEVEKGKKAVMFYLVNRTDAKCFSIAKHIDYRYYEEFLRALKIGVEVLVYNTKIHILENNDIKITINKKLPLVIE